LNKTDITIVLDRSGSMLSVLDDAVNGFNQFIEDQKKVEGEATVTLVQFDTVHEVVYKGKKLEDVPSLDLQPRGFTALLDAVGKAIAEIGEHLKAMTEDDRPKQVIFVILTDGRENSSKEYSLQQVKQMIEHQTNVYKWQFVFLGANQDAIQVAGGMGISAGATMTYAATPEGTRDAFAAVSSGMSRYRMQGHSQAVGGRYFNQDERDKAEVQPEDNT